MRILKFLFATILFVVLFSCTGQTVVEENEKRKSMGAGKTVETIGDGLTRFYEQKNGTLWIASDGIYRYDGNALVHFSEEDGLPGNGIMEMKEGKDGAMYFTTDKGVSKFDGSSFQTLRVKPGTPPSGWKLEPGDLWFKSDYSENLVYRFDGEWLYPLSFPDHPLEDRYPDAFENSPYSPFGIYTIYMGLGGRPFFGTAGAGACHYDGESLLWLIEDDLTELDDGPAPGVRSIVRDSAGFYRFSNDIQHKYTLGHTGYSVMEAFSVAVPKDMPGSVMDMAYDHAGHLWMTTYTEGVWRFDGREFYHYPVKDGNRDMELFSIYVDSKGGVWLGTHKHGVHKFDGREFQVWDPGD